MDTINLLKAAVLGLAVLAILYAACNHISKKQVMESFEKGTFGFDLQFLKTKDSGLVVLKDPVGNAQVALSAKFQGKVFTSTAQGMLGKSFGWINYHAFDHIVSGAHINALGGEDRFWIGPEGGQFSIFFKSGGGMDFDNWFTPASLDTEPWELVRLEPTIASFTKDVYLQNYSGTHFTLTLDRKVELLDRLQIEKRLDISVDGVFPVAFETLNTVTSKDNVSWSKSTGGLCIWMLDMLACGPGVTIVAPYRQGDEHEPDKVATTGYFGEIPPEWLRVTDKAVFLKADGWKRSKIGLSPRRAMPVLGSYDSENGVLTIVKYPVFAEAEYINQQWPRQEKPYEGDAVNAYNDGPLADGSQMGPFYELESSSPALFLGPRQQWQHDHTVFHFAGDEAILNKISEKVLGVGISEITSIF